MKDKDHITSPLYTRKGDSGMTVCGNRRTDKCHPIIEAIGTLDELSCHIGLLSSEVRSGYRPALEEIQRRLFAIGAALSVTNGKDRTDDREMTGLTSGISYFPTAETIHRLEEETDRLSPAFCGFILPGGCRAAAQSHVCRAVCRRAERRVLAARCLAAIPYLNRLSDYFFALARHLNQEEGTPETLLSTHQQGQENATAAKG